VKIYPRKSLALRKQGRGIYPWNLRDGGSSINKSKFGFPLTRQWPIRGFPFYFTTF